MGQRGIAGGRSLASGPWAVLLLRCSSTDTTARAGRYAQRRLIRYVGRSIARYRCMQTPPGGPAGIANAVGAGGREERKHRRPSREWERVERGPPMRAARERQLRHHRPLTMPPTVSAARLKSRHWREAARKTWEDPGAGAMGTAGPASFMRRERRAAILAKRYTLPVFPLHIEW